MSSTILATTTGSKQAEMSTNEQSSSVYRGNNKGAVTCVLSYWQSLFSIAIHNIHPTVLAHSRVCLLVATDLVP